LTPWWLRPTAEGAKEEKEALERAAEKVPESTPSPPAPVAESVPPVPPAPPKDGPAWWKEPAEPAFVEEAGEVEAPLEAAELLPEESELGEAEEEDEELTAQAEPGETAGTPEEARAEARRRRPRRSRGRGRKEGRIMVLNPPDGEEEEPAREEPAVAEEPAPRRIAAAVSAGTPSAAGISPLRSTRSDSYVIPAGDLESVAREIVISVPERQRVSDERKIALFCDFENIALGVRDSDIGKFDIDLMLERLLEKGKIIVKKAYADWERYAEYKRTFHEAAIELIDIPQKYYSGKNSADIKLVVDAMDLSFSKEHLDTFVIMSGDSDFSPLVSKLKENNKYVIGVGVKNSSSALLIDNCDEFIYYEDVWRDSQKGPKLEGLNKKTAEAFSLMIDAIQALIRENKDVLWGSMIKQTMQRKKPSFNESYYGYASFSEMLEDAERKNILRLKKDQRSGTYIVTGFATGKEAASGRR
jgi:uncharacterized protein (TIGR00288 family)